jgi:hypothetical protein
MRPAPTGRKQTNQSMKAIIYAGIGLFSMATVYGLTDYYSSKKTGSLEKLYTEEEPAPVKPDEAVHTKIPVVEATKTVLPEARAVVKKAASKKSKHAAKKFIRAEDFSRARIPEPEPADEILVEEKKPEPATAMPVAALTEKPEIKETEKKISLDMYSRAPLKKKVRPAKTAKQ